MKKSMILSVIEPKTYRVVAQCLNHLRVRYHVSHRLIIAKNISNKICEDKRNAHSMNNKLFHYFIFFPLGMNEGKQRNATKILPSACISYRPN
jgi:hypothetical protein